MFYSDGTTRIERWTLRKEGFNDVKIRKIHGIYQMLAHRYGNGDERWEDLFIEEESILSQIKEYGVIE